MTDGDKTGLQFGRVLKPFGMIVTDRPMDVSTDRRMDERMDKSCRRVVSG